jgi:hypothetical protein
METDFKTGLEKAWQWLQKHWAGLIAAYVLVCIGIYITVWVFIEPLGLPERVAWENLPAFMRHRAFIYVILTLLIGAHITLILELLFRQRTWGALEKATHQISQDDRGLIDIHTQGIVGDYSHVEKAQTINLLSISLRGLLEVKFALKKAVLNNNAIIKILILQPNSQFVTERERQEGYELRKGQIAEECQATIARVKELSRQIRSENAKRIARGLPRSTGRIEVRTYDTMPYCSCVITDELVRYIPYLVYERAGYTPTYDFAPLGELGAAITRHFDALWQGARVEFCDDFYEERPAST